MELLQRLKATGCDTDRVHFDDTAADYKRLRSTLAPADVSTLAVDILCMLSRNLEKAAGWSQRADPDSLLRLCAYAMRDAHCVDDAQRTRAIAAVFHLHRYAIKQKVKPDLVLHLSSFVFSDNETDLIASYHKTYWVILVDKLSYVEQLKIGKAKVSSFIPTIASDVKKVVRLYDSANFCREILNILIKKLYHIFSEESPRDLNGLYEVIFSSLLAKRDAQVKNAAMLDLYRKVSDCFNIIVDNASKYNFRPCALYTAVDFTSKFIDNPDVSDCLSLYMKFSQIFEGEDVEKVLNDVTQSIGLLKCDMADVTFPYLSQIVRTYIEGVAKNPDRWANEFPASAQKIYVKLMAILMERLIHCPQVLKCTDCNIKSGAHDALRLSFSMRHFVNVSLSKGMEIEKNLPYVIRLYDMQANILRKLSEMKCPNSEKCHLKAQTDVHNAAILLYKYRLYEHSMRLFDMYVRIEIGTYAKSEYSERSSLSRAFYNKAICELDASKLEIALRDAYLSLVFADGNGLNASKNMSLVIDIKSKAWKQRTDEDTEDPFQMISVLDAAKVCCESNEYGDLRPLLRTVEFSILLGHEMRAYARLWPSLLPIVGVWVSMHELLQRPPIWARAEGKEDVLWSLYEVCASTACSARTVHHPRIAVLLADLLKELSDSCKNTIKFRVAHCTAMLLKAELDIIEAKNSHGWRTTTKITSENSDNGDETVTCATLRDEHDALQYALRAVDAWTQLLPTLESCDTTEDLRSALVSSSRVASAFVAVLFQHGRDVHATQLAHVCVRLATILRDNDMLAANAGTLLACSLRDSGAANALSARAASALRDGASSEGDLIFLCQAAKYHLAVGRLALAACLVRYVQLTILAAGGAPGMELATVHLLEAQALLVTRDDSTSITTLTSLNAVHRHCLQTRSSGSSWVERRHRSSLLEQLSTRAGLAVARAAACVLLARRARAAAEPALRTACAGQAARVQAVVAWTNLTASDIQVKIDTIKSILGVPLKAAAEINEISSVVKPMKGLNLEVTKSDAIESVLDLGTFKKTQNSPASPYFDVQAFSMPEFLSHGNACECYACLNPWHAVLCLELTGLEAATYFRSQESAIAKNYFSGAMKMLKYVDAKINHTFNLFKKKSYDEYSLDIVRDNVFEELKRVKVKILTEYTLYLLSEDNYSHAERSLQAANEILQQFIVKDLYVENELMNLECALESLKNKVAKVVEAELGIDEALDSLKLSPSASVNALSAKTPNVKVEIPKAVKPKITISADELPAVKRRVIKLNLDDDSPQSEPDKPKTNSAFKIPVPKTTQAVPEIITPRVTRSSRLPVKAKNSQPKSDSSNSDKDVKTAKSKPALLRLRSTASGTDSSAEEKESQKNQSPDIFEEDVFYTPLSKPVEQFFTPMSTMKTYGKSLRRQAVKNLESEFQTPKHSVGSVKAPEAASVTSGESTDGMCETDSSGQSDGKKNESQSKASLKTDSRRTLKRATSPGKLDARRKAPPRTARPQVRKNALKMSPDEPILDTNSGKM